MYYLLQILCGSTVMDVVICFLLLSNHGKNFNVVPQQSSSGSWSLRLRLEICFAYFRDRTILQCYTGSLPPLSTVLSNRRSRQGVGHQCKGKGEYKHCRHFPIFQQRNEIKKLNIFHSVDRAEFVILYSMPILSRKVMSEHYRYTIFSLCYF